MNNVDNYEFVIGMEGRPTGADPKDRQAVYDAITRSANAQMEMVRLERGLSQEGLRAEVERVAGNWRSRFSR